MNQSPYSPTQPQRRRLWHWYRRRHPLIQISLGCASLLVLSFVGVFCAAGIAVATGHGAPMPTPALTAPVTQVPTHTTQIAHKLATPTSAAHKAKPTTTPTPVPSPTGVDGNPWGYNFASSGGSLIYNPPTTFCSYFNCISDFWNGRGFVNECVDGTFSKSGGISGDCSHHGGEKQPLYSH